MDLLQNATDDQMAMLGCCVALFASAALMYLSVFLNRTHRSEPVRDLTTRKVALKVHESGTAVSPAEAAARKVA